MNQRVNDNDLIKENCFMWCNKWKDCLVSAINDVQSIYLQIVSTLTFKKFRVQSVK